jgi:hypothetical protein
MTKSADLFRFTAMLERFARKGGNYFVRFPFDVREIFGTGKSVRMVGHINTLAVERALIPHGDGTHHILVSTSIRVQLKIRLGDQVNISLKRDERPIDHVELPEELYVALEQDAEAYRRFQLLKHGDRRSMAIWVNSAKGLDTRIKRALDLVKRLQNDQVKFGGLIIDLRQ